MNLNFLDKLRCPETGQKLDYLSLENDGDNIKKGILFTESGEWYPIVKSVPRLLRGKYRFFDENLFDDHLHKLPVAPKDMKDRKIDEDQKQVQESFSEKWLTAQDWGIEGESKDFFRSWFIEKYGWKNQKELSQFLSDCEQILDIGCGTGRDLLFFRELSPESIYFGLDISQSIEVAAKRLLPSDNVLLVQADLNDFPFANKIFDFIHSEGVLHHTPDTKTAFMATTEGLKQGAEMEFYVYRKKAPIREYVDTEIRDYTSQLSFNECWKFSKKITKLGKQLHEAGGGIKIEESIPYFEFPAEKCTIQRFIYNHLFKCFWNEDMSFEENCAINFDWYSPRYAHRHTKKEIEGWLKEAGLKLCHWNEEPSGYSVRVTIK